jgi:hypothetical protein
MARAARVGKRTHRRHCGRLAWPRPWQGGAGPRIWFQVVPEAETVKNRLHLDICAGGG